MTPNDVLRRLHSIFQWDDSQWVGMFAHAGLSVTPEQVESWLKEDEEDGFVPCLDVELASFLNGWIVENRGKKDGPQPVPEEQLTNNMIFKKIKIALNLKNDDLLYVYEWAGVELGGRELGPYFRKPGHKHYRPCPDEVLEQFFDGLEKKHDFDSSED
ncbi:MAG: DUF1456 family protein [Deltaproteobacteria bacterium]|nr:MAG: DUF1456 family protein [Deltaproteobacteria bacterium]